MKNHLTIMFILLSVACFGQIEKGTFRIGGSGNLSYSSSKTSSNVPGFSYTQREEILQAQFSVAYFPVKNFSFGLTGTGYGAVKSSGPNIPGDYDRQELQLGPEFRYYYKNFFVQGAYLIGLEADYKIQGGIGYAVFLTDKIAFEPALLYTHGYTKHYLGGGRTDTNLELNLGFSFYLNKKK